MIKILNGANEQEQMLVEKATEIINNSIEAKLDHSTYIRTYSELQDDVLVFDYVNCRLGKKRTCVS